MAGRGRLGGFHESAKRERAERERMKRLNLQRQRKELIHHFAEACGLKRLSGVWEAFDFLEDPLSVPYEACCWDNTGRLYFGRSRATGSLLLVLECEEVCIAFADLDTFEAVCEARWRRLAEANDSPQGLFLVPGSGSLLPGPPRRGVGQVGCRAEVRALRTAEAGLHRHGQPKRVAQV
jgi:hypothetical protein